MQIKWINWATRFSAAALLVTAASTKAQINVGAGFNIPLWGHSEEVMPAYPPQPGLPIISMKALKAMTKSVGVDLLLDHVQQAFTIAQLSDGEKFGIQYQVSNYIPKPSATVEAVYFLNDAASNDKFMSAIQTYQALNGVRVDNGINYYIGSKYKWPFIDPGTLTCNGCQIYPLPKGSSLDIYKKATRISIANAMNTASVALPAGQAAGGLALPSPIFQTATNTNTSVTIPAFSSTPIPAVQLSSNSVTAVASSSQTTTNVVPPAFPNLSLDAIREIAMRFGVQTVYGDVGFTSVTTGDGRSIGLRYSLAPNQKATVNEVFNLDNPKSHDDYVRCQIAQKALSSVSASQSHWTLGQAFVVFVPKSLLDVGGGNGFIIFKAPIDFNDRTNYRHAVLLDVPLSVGNANQSVPVRSVSTNGPSPLAAPAPAP